MVAVVQVKKETEQMWVQTILILKKTYPWYWNDGIPDNHDEVVDLEDNKQVIETIETICSKKFLQFSR